LFHPSRQSITGSDKALTASEQCQCQAKVEVEGLSSARSFRRTKNPTIALRSRVFASHEGDLFFHFVAFFSHRNTAFERYDAFLIK
jgi:hypothetical protein